jgi:transcriptional regulator with XRE-family HTH domain
VILPSLVLASLIGAACDDLFTCDSIAVMATRINGEALRAIRERTGLTVSELARKGGVSQPHLSNIELGRRGGRPPIIRALADALGVPVGALLGPTPDQWSNDRTATLGADQGLGILVEPLTES